MEQAKFNPDESGAWAYFESLYRLARILLRGRLSNRLGASDVVQETFLEAFEKRHQFRGTCEREWVSWLVSILRNKILNLLRREGRGIRNAAAEIRFEGALDQPTGIMRQFFGGESRSPSNLFEIREQIEKLMDALEKLPPDQRSAVILCDFENRSYREISEELQRSPAAVNGLLSRGREAILAQFPESG